MANITIDPRAVQKHYTDLTEVVSRGKIPAALFESSLITDDTLDAALNATRTTLDKGATIMRDVRQALRINPHEIFTNFCDALSKEPVVKAVLDAIKG